MFRKGLSKAKITALAVALCMISMSLKEEGALASASSRELYTWPVPTSSQIEKNYSDEYDGIDILPQGENTQVVVARDGIVEVAKGSECMHVCNYPEYCCNSGMGNYVKIRHDDGTYAIYSHLKAGSVTVNEEQKVKAGDMLGIMGASGRTKKVCLHFSVAFSENKSINTNPDVMKYKYLTDQTVQEEVRDAELWKITVENGVNFRSGAGTTFQKLGKIPCDEQVEVFEQIEIDGVQWGKTTYDGDNGWFALEYAEEANYEGEDTDVKNEASKKNIYVDLKFDTNGGECDYSSYMYTKGSIIGELPIPTRSGHKFLGWYTKRTEGTAVTMQDQIVEEMTVYAHWD